MDLLELSMLRGRKTSYFIPETPARTPRTELSMCGSIQLMCMGSGGRAGDGGGTFPSPVG